MHLALHNARKLGVATTKIVKGYQAACVLRAHEALAPLVFNLHVDVALTGEREHTILGAHPAREPDRMGHRRDALHSDIGVRNELAGGKPLNISEVGGLSGCERIAEVGA